MTEDRAPEFSPLADPFDGLYNTEMEQMVVAGVLFSPAVFKRIQFLKPEDFAYGGNGRIWAELCAMIHKGDEITPMVLMQRLQDAAELESAGGRQYIIHLSCNPVGRINTEEYAKAVHDLAIKRRLLALAKDAMDGTKATDLTASEMIGAAMSGLRELLADGPRGGLTKREVAERLVGGLGEPLPCYSTGIRGLDNIMGGGLFQGKLYGLAARKKVGKSTCLGSISHNLNAAGIHNLFISLEAGSAQLEQRNAARDGGFNSIRFLKRDDPALAERVANYAVSVRDATIYEDIPGASFDHLRSIVMQHIAADGIKGVILDYWQLVGGKAAKETEEYHLRNVAQWLADTAARENVFVLAAAQVNQTGNTRGGEGLKLACDWYGTLHREKDEKGAWVEMEECRYTMYQNLGSETAPGLWMDPHGPHFRDVDDV